MKKVVTSIIIVRGIKSHILQTLYKPAKKQQGLKKYKKHN